MTFSIICQGGKSMKRILTTILTTIMLLTATHIPVSVSAASVKKPAKVSLTSVQTVSTTSLKVTWKNVEEATGYQIKVSTNKTFKKARTVNTVNASMKTITKLKKSGTKYYVKIRAYTKVNGNKKYGKWSNIKAGKTKAKNVVRRKTTSYNTRTTTTTNTMNYALTYVLNPDSMKVHKKGCRTFKYESQYPTTNDLDGALLNGYSMCGVCWR